MDPFLLGLAIGATGAAICAGVLYTALRAAPEEPDEWSEDFYLHRRDEPPVTTKVMIHERRIEL